MAPVRRSWLYCPEREPRHYDRQGGGSMVLRDRRDAVPVGTLPTGLSRGGLPVGVRIIGPFLSDLRLLRIAELLDAAAGPGFTSRPVAADRR